MGVAKTMKPTIDTLAVITATTDIARERTQACMKSWHETASYDWPVYCVFNGDDEQNPFLGVVPAFARGVAEALAKTTADIIVCLHDDVEITEHGWDARILRHFGGRPNCGLVGFGGGRTLGHPDIYKIPYVPMQLARGTFVSNMREAEAHGWRVTMPVRVACLDGFSQIGRRAFWEGRKKLGLDQLGTEPTKPYAEPDANGPDLFQRMTDLGIVHHAYDAALGCYAKRLGWETWMLPVACHHYGGVTAVADGAYHEWARTQTDGGDQAFWLESHRLVYDEFKDVLPFGVI